MFRPMRRARQELGKEECELILERGTHGVLALQGDEGYPYAVPVSYAYADGAVYFHGAKTGHKPDSIARCDKASFCIVDQDELHREEYTTYYRSVIVFGRIRMLSDAAELRRAGELLGRRYGSGQTEEELQAYLDKYSASFAAAKLEIEHMSGKAAIELIREKK